MYRSILRRLAAVLTALTMTVAGLVMTALPASAATGGFNVDDCRPSDDSPEPVVLAHGLGGNKITNWAVHGPALARAGHCVYSFTYGQGIFGSLAGGLKSMRSSAEELKTFVAQVKDETGAEQVDIVGHSAGTTVTAYYLKFLDGAQDVESFVGFGSNYKGTTLSGLRKLALAVLGFGRIGEFISDQCKACREFLPPSEFLDDLNDGPVTVPGVRYTNIVSKFDIIVTPYTSGVLDEPGVNNIVLQDRCRRAAAGHLTMAIHPSVTKLILENLSANAPQARC